MSRLTFTGFLIISFQQVELPTQCSPLGFRFRDELKMNVNQQHHMASPYGQSQSGYGGQQMPGGYTAPYGPYNGPASNYQTGPPQGNCKYVISPYMNNNERH